MISSRTRLARSMSSYPTAHKCSDLVIVAPRVGRFRDQCLKAIWILEGFVRHGFELGDDLDWSRPSEPRPPGTRQEAPRSWPRPLIALRLVNSVLVGIALAVDLHVAQLLLDMRAGDPQARYPIDDVDRETEAVDLVTNGQIERRVDVALLLVAAHVQVLVIGAPVGQPMDQPRISVEVEDNGLVRGE